MFVTEIRNIPYFDGHCDTIYECMGKGRSLRENCGHVDLMRGQRYGRRAQFFALFDNVRELPEGSGRRELEDSQRKFNGCGSFPIKGFSLCSLSFPRDLHPAKAWDSPMSC